jgi:hypothetical protein
VFLNLAKRLAPGFGKQLNAPDAGSSAPRLRHAAVGRRAAAEQQLPNTMARGAGNKPWRTANRPFLPRPDTSPLRPATAASSHPAGVGDGDRKTEPGHAERFASLVPFYDPSNGRDAACSITRWRR